MSCYFPHIIPQHWGGSDKERIALWAQMQKESGATPFIKIVSASDGGMVPQIENMPKDATFIIRDYLTSINWGKRGITDADAAVEMAWQHASRARGIAEMLRDKYGNITLLFEGLNEPEIWGSEPPGLVSCYEAERLKWLHTFGLHGVVLNLSVGWPNNKGKDTPPDWTPFDVIHETMRDGDYLGLHEYWGYNGPQENWGWWAGRFGQCPWDVPILITECGIDSLVAGDTVHHGWQNLPLNSMDDKAWQYVQWLRWYEQHFDRRIKGACIFTWDIGEKTWETFDIRNDPFWRHWLPYLQDMSIKPSTVEPTLEPVVVSETWGDANISPWKGLCEEYGRIYNLDARIIGTIIKIESNGKPDLIAPSQWGEVGLMQIIPGEIEGFSERPSTSNLLQPAVNIEWGCKILAWYVKLFGDIRKGLLAYNAGERWVQNNPNATDTSVSYIAKFSAAWQKLWNAPLPFPDVETPATGETIDMTAVRWNAEETVREIEATVATLQAARQRLLDNVIPQLYKLEE